MILQYLPCVAIFSDQLWDLNLLFVQLQMFVFYVLCQNLFLGWETISFKISKCYVGEHDVFYKTHSVIHKKIHENQYWEAALNHISVVDLD